MIALCLAHLGGCMAMMSDRKLAMKAPIGKPREAMTSQERAMRDELSGRSRKYPRGLDVDALALLIRRQISAQPEKLFTVVGSDESNGLVELEIAFPREYESQRDVIVVVGDRAGNELLAYRPWRWSFSIFQLSESHLPLANARFHVERVDDADRVDLVLRVFIVPYGHLESAADSVISADDTLLVLQRSVFLEW